MSLLTDIAANTKWTQVLQSTTVAALDHAIGPDSQRYGIGFSNSGSNPLTLTLLADNPGGGGIILQVGEFRWFTVKDYGSIVQVDWYINSGGIPSAYNVFTLTFPKE